MSLRQRALVTITATGLMAGGLTGVANAAPAGPPPGSGSYTLSCEGGTSIARATTRHTRVKLDGGSLGRTSSVTSKATESLSGTNPPKCGYTGIMIVP